MVPELKQLPTPARQKRQPLLCMWHFLNFEDNKLTTTVLIRPHLLCGQSLTDGTEP